MRSLDPKNIDLVVGIVMRGLPEGFAERKRALVTLHTMLPKSHAAGNVIASMLASMNHIERLQASLGFQKKGTP